MPTHGIGSWVHRVQVQGPITSVPDPEGGGWIDTFGPLDPGEWDCSIVPATRQDLESIGAGTVISQATHHLNGWYHAGLTTKCRVLATVAGVVHTMNVIFVGNPKLQNVETDLVCAEVVE